MKSDIEIARSIELKKIKQVAESVDIPRDEVENYGRYIAKIPTHLIDEEKVKKSNLILVTAITATKAGIGKTTVSIGLALGLNKIGKKAIVALREPSLGPCFGMKGGAAGGGYAQVLPMEKINLHFTGDFHAITSAHNMISALLDNYLYQHQADGFGLKEIIWRRVLDVNDRSLRSIVTGLGPSTNGITEESGFDITPASEIMAILCLATDLDDLRRRLFHAAGQLCHHNFIGDFHSERRLFDDFHTQAAHFFLLFGAGLAALEFPALFIALALVLFL